MSDLATTHRRAAAVNGWLVIDKPAGLSSAGVVARVRRAVGMAKAGHGGTLDPLATGILPIALGEATKTVSYVMDGAKLYRFTVCWGEQRNTDDAEGEVVATSDIRPDAAAIEAILPSFIGEIEQIPPTYSAVKIAGKRAYALARADMEVTLGPRLVSIVRIELEAMPDRDHAVFRVAAGKGVYMRSIARDMALALGTRGYIANLRRLSVGPFCEDQAISLEQLDAMRHSGSVAEALLPVGVALAGIPALHLTAAEARSLQHGRPIAVLPVASRSPLRNVAAGAIVCATADGKPIALAEIKGGELRPLRVLNL